MNSTQITLRNVHRLPAFSRRVQEKCEALGRLQPELTYCRVRIEREAARPAAPYVVTIRLGMPGGEIVVGHQHHLDPHLAVRDAFLAARRRLNEARYRQDGRSRRSVPEGVAA